MADDPNVDFFNRESQSFQDNSNAFTDFLRVKLTNNPKIFTDMLEAGDTRFIVRLDDPDLARAFEDPMTNIIQRPLAFIAPFEDALTRFINLQHSNVILGNNLEFSVGFDGAFGGRRVSPRDLDSRRLCQLVCVEGIATKVGMIRPKVNQSVYSCEATGRTMRYTFHDHASLVGRPTSTQFPTKDEAGNPLTTEFGLSRYEDRQSLAIQEMPERAPPGLLPCSIDVVLSRDLCDRCKPGDRIQIVGVYRPVAQSQLGSEVSGFFKAILVATSVSSLSRQSQISSALSDEDVARISAFEAKHGAAAMDVLARSVAPSIHGHQDIKAAILMMLLGGVEKNLDNGTHIRGDINVLMCGDPSTAKSQLLRFVLHIAPLAINTTGRGSSGVGLTAAVTMDKETGERRLEAGAMVLADRGVVCIDEFDKMSDLDRVAIHEVMEQQTVTIAKAGLHMSLNARCSVLAAANPVYGRYDKQRAPHANIGLQDSLLSRFDLLFIVTDDADPARDQLIARRVLSNHRYRSTAQDEMLSHATENMMDEDLVLSGVPGATAGAASKRSAEVYVKYDVSLHSGMSDLVVKNGQITNMVTTSFLKKYVQHARERCAQTQMTPEAMLYVEEKYAELRNDAAGTGSGGRGGAAPGRALPVTARALETLIRLASARAKARLSVTVTREDCREAFHLVRKTMLAMSGAEKAGDSDADADDDDAAGDDDESSADDDDNDGDDTAGGTAGGDDDDDEEEEEEEAEESNHRVTAKRSQPSQPQGARTRRGAPTSADAAATAADATSQAKRTRPAPAAVATPASEAAPASEAGAPFTAGGALTAARVNTFGVAMNRAFRAQRVEELSFDDLLVAVNRGVPAGTAPFGADEAEAVLDQLQAQNKCMFRDGIITLM
jgi:DNA replication licensing factor MCM3